MRFARCPRCWRLDLSRWSLEDYHVSFFSSLLLNLGANPYRCEYCRVNFVSFRKRKERYKPQRRKEQRKHGHQQEPAGEPSSGESSAQQRELAGPFRPRRERILTSGVAQAAAPGAPGQKNKNGSK